MFWLREKLSESPFSFNHLSLQILFSTEILNISMKLLIVSALLCAVMALTSAIGEYWSIMCLWNRMENWWWKSTSVWIYPDLEDEEGSSGTEELLLTGLWKISRIYFCHSEQKCNVQQDTQLSLWYKRIVMGYERK